MVRSDDRSGRERETGSRARLFAVLALMVAFVAPQDLRAEVTGAAEPAAEAAADPEAGPDVAAAAEGEQDAVSYPWEAEDQLLPKSEAQITQRERALIARPDRRRPEEGLTVDVFGRPLLFGVQFRTRTRYENGRFDKGIGTLDQTTFSGGIDFDVFYPFTETISIFLGGKALMEERWAYGAPGRYDISETRLERNEMWLFWGNMFGTPFGTQVGGQRFSDRREWWWDQNLDAVRLRFDHELTNVQIAVSEGMVPLGTGESKNFDPEDEDILRVLGQASFALWKDHRVGLFALYQDDHSNDYSIGDLINKNDEDEADADLVWFGLSASGKFRTDSVGRFRYWLNAAGVVGDETFYDFGGVSSRRELEGVNKHNVRGFGVDAWTSWQLPFIGEPALTIGYAYGSGDDDISEERDKGFRQTGIQDNNDRFFGVNNFRYYGPLFDPELSNMHIFTAGLGFRFLERASVELMYHYYMQARAAPYVRDAGFKLDPGGQSRSLGDELDLIFGFEWPHVELELEGSIFRAGSAYNPVEIKDVPPPFRDFEDELIYQATLEIKVNF
jgi:hypothetical protein